MGRHGHSAARNWAFNRAPRPLPAVGSRWAFKAPAVRARYGMAATVEAVSESVGRSYGTRTTWVDLLTDTGVRIQWPVGDVRRRMRPLEGEPGREG